MSLIRAFNVKYGKNIHPSRLPAQSYYESYEEKLSNTSWRAEPLTHVVSLQEEEKQKALRPEPARGVGIHLDSSLSIQTQRRFMSSVPTTIEDLRTKYKVMANMFLLAQMRQPSRHLYRGLEVNTFSDFLDELLRDRNFLMESDDDEKLVIPPWNQCLNYEFNIRKEAVRFCMEEGFALKDALWHVLADKEHRMQHWILKLTIANVRQDTSKVQKLDSDWLRLRSRGEGHGHRVVKHSARCQHNMLFQRRRQEGTGKGQIRRRIRVSPFFPGPQNSQCKKTLSGKRMLEVPIELVQGCQLHTQARMCRMRQSRYAVRFLRLPRDENLNFLLTSDWLLAIARSWVERFFLCFYATGTCEVFYRCFPHFGPFKWYGISD